jgi:hypothetical protein
MRDGRGDGLVFCVVIVVRGLIVNLGEKLGGDPAASLCRADLGVVD